MFIVSQFWGLEIQNQAFSAPSGTLGSLLPCLFPVWKRCGSIPGLGRSPGEGNGNLFQYSCLENPMDRGAWQATVHGAPRPLVPPPVTPLPPPAPLLPWLPLETRPDSPGEPGMQPRDPCRLLTSRLIRLESWVHHLLAL